MQKGENILWSTSNALKWIALGFVFVMVSSCKVNKFLKPNEYLVDKVKVEIESPYDDYDEDRIRNGLSYFIQQRKNGSILGVPKEYIYWAHAEPHDTSKYDKGMRNVMGEEPSIYSEEKSKETVSRMQSWLRYTKGFYGAKVDFESRNRSYKTDVYYKAKLGRRYRYGPIEFISVDTAILEKVKSLWHEAGVIKQGDFVDGDRFNSERNRITEALQNMGYADFAAKYIGIKGDSIGGDHTIDLFIEIYPPENADAHRVYKVGDITVYTDFYTKQDTFSMTMDTLDDIVYKKESVKFLVQPEVIDKVLLFREGELARKEPRLKTFTKLSNLSTYRFTSINPKLNPQDSTLIDYDVLLSPYPRKWIADYGADLLYSRLGGRVNPNSPLAGRNIFGLSVNGQLINRNFLGGSERYSLTGEIGSQIELSNPVRIRTYNYSLSNYLEYPIFKDHLGQVRMLHNLGFVRNSSYKKLQEKAVSTVNLALSSTDIRDFYRIIIVNGSYGYKVADKVDRSLSINTLGITLNSYELRGSFLDIVSDNPLILNTFQDNLFTGFLFRNMLYSRSGYFNNRSYQWALYSNFEVSGLEVLGANALSNLITGNNDEWTIGKNDRFNFAKFGKIEMDGRFYKNFGKKHVLASRINAGIILPVGDSASAPFIKQFDVGGPNSLRGWGARELGPGASIIDLNGEEILPFQKGDIKIEANLEYRFPIWFFINGGLFTDVGNVWTLKDNQDNGQFTSDFVDQLAVAAGWGIRFDFDYFLIRIDFGYRIRNPYPSENPDRFGKHWNTFRGVTSQGLGNFQVNVNHAF